MMLCIIRGILLLLSLGAMGYYLSCLYSARDFPPASTVSGFTPPSRC